MSRLFFFCLSQIYESEDRAYAEPASEETLSRTVFFSHAPFAITCFDRLKTVDLRIPIMHFRYEGIFQVQN